MNLSDRLAAVPFSTGVRRLRLSLGLVYIWFGVLKFFPDLSPADGLAKDTMDHLFFGVIPRDLSILLLAALEVVIGAMLMLNLKVRSAVYLALFHMVCTFTPLFFFPDISFRAPLIFTLLGQYIMKNVVFVAALLLIFPKNTPNEY